MKFASNVLTAAAAALVLASSASAQVFNYSTMGQFTSAAATCNGAVATTVAVCQGPVAGGLALTFTGSAPSAFGYNTGSQITLGTFTPSGAGSATIPPPVINFTLFINQTMPNVGSSSTVGSISGTFTLGVGPSFSDLVWTPTNQNISIAPVNYALIYDQGSNGIRIGAEFPTSIGAIGTVSTVPEPSTYALMGAGLAGLGMLSRRRRTA